MGRKENIIRDMERLGIYEPAYLPAIDDLVTRERERSAIRKEWKATAEPGKRPSFEHPLYSKIETANRDINKMRYDLGLVPKGLESIRKKAASSTSDAVPIAGTANQGFAALMDKLKETSHAAK